MNASEFDKELERVGLEKKHADEAFAWLREHGKQGLHDVFYYRSRPKEGAAVWAALDKKGNRYFKRQAAALVYLFACKDKDKWVEKPPFDKKYKSKKVKDMLGYGHDGRVFKKLYIKVVGFGEDGEEYSEDEEVIVESDEELSPNKMVPILQQFNQIIFYGPPGTGKTRNAKLLLARLFGFAGSDDDALHKLQERKDEDECWDIVQFHPSYNYEDFVRGIKVETAGSGDNSHVAYKTVNRIFGEMCERAHNNHSKKYGLIIDEINRANVSAVLGELIYALEYRDEPVNTPYKVNGKEDLIVPKNLYIIGTMNSADRTIGQIDYAVRRRFAFVHCPPDESVIEDDEASKFFDDVDAIFDNDISQDYDADDVRIGHSYFLASGIKLANKIIYQVVPILREYVKDGVLKKNAESEINRIEERAKKLLADESENSDPPAEDLSESEDKKIFHWSHTSGRYGGPDGVVGTAFNVIKDFIESHPDKNAEELENEFDNIRRKCVRRQETINKENVNSRDTYQHRRYYFDKPIKLKSGETVLVSSRWGATGDSERVWNAFKKYMAEEHGYTIERGMSQ